MDTSYWSIYILFFIFTCHIDYFSHDFFSWIFVFNMFVGYITVPGNPVSLTSPWEMNSVARWTYRANWTTRSVTPSTLSSASNTLVSSYLNNCLNYFLMLYIRLWILVLCKKLTLRLLLLATLSPPSTDAATTQDPETTTDAPDSTTRNVEKPQCDPLKEYKRSWPSASEGDVVSCPCKTETGTIPSQHSTWSFNL